MLVKSLNDFWLAKGRVAAPEPSGMATANSDAFVFFRFTDSAAISRRST
jgi:hypothetical protein